MTNYMIHKIIKKSKFCSTDKDLDDNQINSLVLELVGDLLLI